MNSRIRQLVRFSIQAEGLSQAEFARQIGMTPQELNRALQERGKPPAVWQRILGALNLELTALPKERE